MEYLTKKEIETVIMGLANRLVLAHEKGYDGEIDHILSASEKLWKTYQTAPGEPAFQPNRYSVSR